MDLLALDARIRASHLAPVQLHGQPASWVLADRLEALAAFPQFMDEHAASPVAVNAAFVKLANAFQRSSNLHVRRMVCRALWQCRRHLPLLINRDEVLNCMLAALHSESGGEARFCAIKALGILAPITRQRLDVAYYVGDYLNREIYGNHEHALAAMSTLDALCDASKKAAAIVYRDIHRYAADEQLMPGVRAAAQRLGRHFYWLKDGHDGGPLPGT